MLKVGYFSSGAGQSASGSKINSKPIFLASVYRMNWSSMKELVLKNAATGLITTDLHYKDVNLYSVGLLYRYTPKLTLLSGVGLGLYTGAMATVIHAYPILTVLIGPGAQHKINAMSSLDMLKKYLFYIMSLLMIRDDSVNWVRSAVKACTTQPCSVYLTIERSDSRCKKGPCISTAFFLLVRTNRQLLILTLFLCLD